MAMSLYGHEPSFLQLALPGVALRLKVLDKFIGKGVYYGASRSEVSATQGLEIHLIGAGNSAGQAALYFANYAREVTLVVRGTSLGDGMSHYLVDQIRNKVNISIALRSEVQMAQGDTHLTATILSTMPAAL